MSRAVGFTLTAKGIAALAELRQRYEITPVGRAALAEARHPSPRSASRAHPLRIGVTMYQETIRQDAAALGCIGVNTRHVEAWMRVEHGTLDHLSRAQFRAEVKVAIACVQAAPTDQSETLARSFGLVAR